MENEDMKLDNMFMASLVGDIIRVRIVRGAGSSYRSLETFRSFGRVSVAASIKNRSIELDHRARDKGPPGYRRDSNRKFDTSRDEIVGKEYVVGHRSARISFTLGRVQFLKSQPLRGKFFFRRSVGRCKLSRRYVWNFPPYVPGRGRQIFPIFSRATNPVERLLPIEVDARR